jgi:hypothetical protein
MGLCDKIKYNAKAISMMGIESTNEYADEDPKKPAPKPAVQSSPVAQKPNKKVKPSESQTNVTSSNQTEPTTEATVPTEINQSLPLPSELDATQPFVETPVPAAPKPAAYEPNTQLPTNNPLEKATTQQTEQPKDTDPDGYVPYYKKESARPVATEREIAVNKAPEPPKLRLSEDIKAVKIDDPERRAYMSRERAAIAELSNQRRLEGKTALFTTSHLNFKTRVFINRIEYSGTFGKNVLPIEQVAWIRLRHGGTGVMIETTNGKKVVMVINPKDRLSFADAVMKMQSLVPKVIKINDSRTVRLDVLDKVSQDVDDIERIASLYKRGLITKAEYELKKKQILDI